MVEELSALDASLIEGLLGLGDAGLVGIRVHDSQHLVVGVIDIELHGVLVVREQSVVAIGEISEGAALS